MTYCCHIWHYITLIVQPLYPDLSGSDIIFLVFQVISGSKEMFDKKVYNYTFKHNFHILKSIQFIIFPQKCLVLDSQMILLKNRPKISLLFV